MSLPWPRRQLRDMADVRVSNVDKKIHAGEKSILLCNYLDVYSNDYITAKLDFMHASASVSEIARFGLNRGDVIITKDSETPDDIGVPAVVAEEVPGLICGYHLALIRPDGHQLDSVYLAKQLSTPVIARFFGRQSSGSTRYGLPISAIQSVMIPTPPKPEQSRIAEILSTIDIAIEQTEDLLAKQERIKVGMMQDLLTRGINGKGMVRTLEADAFLDSELGKIPQEWRIARVGELFEQRRQHGKAGLPIMSIVMNDGLVERTLVERRVESALSPERHALVRDGDIAYNMMRMWQGVLGRASFDCLVSPAYIVLRPRSGINSHFAEWLFRDKRSIQKFRKASRGVVDDRLRLYTRDLFAIKFALPRSAEEQRAISTQLEVLRRQIILETAALNQYRRLRTGLMHDLLSGTKRVMALIEPERQPERIYA
jgi:type I restriction enzyme S subunit